MPKDPLFYFVYSGKLIAYRARELTSFDEINIDVYSFFCWVQFYVLHKPWRVYSQSDLHKVFVIYWFGWVRGVVKVTHIILGRSINIGFMFWWGLYFEGWVMLVFGGSLKVKSL